MKAAPFNYIRAENLDQVLVLLDQHGGECKLIAGGQSLVPMMAMRLARPSVLVDINRLTALKNVIIGSECVQMGAITRQCDVENDHALHATLPLVRDALRWVGHIQTRNRGTVGGSLVHADPSAELPLAAVVLDASLLLRSKYGGERQVKALDFFQGPMFTALTDTECLVRVDWPVWQGDGVSTAFEETAMRRGDFAMASAACQLQRSPDGVCRRAAIGMGGVDGTPLAFPEIAEQLVGRRIDAALAREVAQMCAMRTEPGADLFADVPYRRHLADVLMTRVLLRAASDQPALH
jgi:CO/xanthine dehydrogenase FAD-binding subunit